jgi:hypothetical protein
MLGVDLLNDVHIRSKGVTHENVWLHRVSQRGK